MAGAAASKAIVPSGEPVYRPHRQAERRPATVRGGSENFALERRATLREQLCKSRPHGGAVGDRVSWRVLRYANAMIVHSALIPAVLTMGHHFSISALRSAASAFGVCCSRG